MSKRRPDRSRFEDGNNNDDPKGRIVPLAEHEHLIRFYYLEAFIIIWETYAVTILGVGVAVYQTVDVYSGTAIFIASIVSMLLGLVGGVFWVWIGETDVVRMMAARRILVVVSCLVILVHCGLCFWAAAKMIQNI